MGAAGEEPGRTELVVTAPNVEPFVYSPITGIRARVRSAVGGGQAGRQPEVMVKKTLSLLPYTIKISLHIYNIDFMEKKITMEL